MQPFDPRPLMAAITSWATSPERGCRLSGSAGGLGYLQLHTRPDPQAPEVQLTFQPMIVDGHPVIRVEHPSLQRSARTDATASADGATDAARVQRVHSAPTGRDPEALCDSCGIMGTVGRATRTDREGAVIDSYRFCLACWPEQAARYRARWSEEDRVWQDRFMRGREPARGAGTAMAFEAATWHGTLELVQNLERLMIAPMAPSKEGLAEIARQIEANAPRVEGEMPWAVEAFIIRYRASA